MNSEKIEDLLNLALDATDAEREKSLNLQVGYESAQREWELIIKYDQAAGAQREELASAVPLSYGYGIIRVSETEIDQLASLPEVEYIEKPKKLFFAVDQGKAASCFSGLPIVSEDIEAISEGQAAAGGGSSDTGGTVTVPLSGNGIITAIIDSGVDYFHPDFRGWDGSTRILDIWDQTVSSGNPPAGFLQGTEFSREEINRALSLGSRGAGYEIVPSVDYSGHGTAVLGITAGNGNASGGRYAGGAPQSDILVVKLGTPGLSDFPSTTQLMQAMEYVTRKAVEYQKPISVNLSFGNVYGSHSGTSRLETYMNEMAGAWKSVIVVGAGNEGSAGGHASGRLTDAEIEIVELAVAEYETNLNLQLWKNFADEFDITLVHPAGQRISLTEPFSAPSGPASSVSGIGGAGTSRYRLSNTEILVYYGTPTPYSQNQEIYLDFIPAGQVGSYIASGVWQIELMPRRIASGIYDMWLPGVEALNRGTGFLRPSPEVTLTIPSTAEKVITVGAYNSHTLSYAAFSGRGYTRSPEKIKPELAAPGVDIITTAVGGGYATVTGTSFAAPFVTAASALLMQWGLAAGNDPYLYGEKVKAYLIKGARRLPGFTQWPNPQLGWGTLCVRESFPLR